MKDSNELQRSMLVGDPLNVLFILSEHHNPQFLGCYGNPITQTPNLDRLAAEGVRFAHTYCTSPHCVPARGGLWSGRHAFETGVWCNALPWDGKDGWAEYLTANSVHVASIGKLDFKPDVSHGLTEEIVPIHRSSPDIHSLYREEEIIPRFKDLATIRGSRGRDDYPSDSRDAVTMAHTIDWLKNKRPSRPWLLNVNFMKVHPVWAPPAEYWNRYAATVTAAGLQEMFSRESDHPHPFMRSISRHLNADYITDDDVIRAHIGFHGYCEMLDHEIGQIIQTLEDEGLLDTTMIIYSSDHGANVHAHRCWTLLNLWEGSAGVPLIIRDPHGVQGAVDGNPTHHHDIFPTIAQAMGLKVPGGFRGHSLLGAVRKGDTSQRTEFTMCEIHNNGWPASSFALKDGIWKMIYCVGERPLLFNLQQDPQELHDLVLEKPDDPEVQQVLQRLEGYLRSVCDPEAVDKQAKADQAAYRAELEASGQLVKEVARRGYLPDTSRLIPDPELLKGLGVEWGDRER